MSSCACLIGWVKAQVAGGKKHVEKIHQEFRLLVERLKAKTHKVTETPVISESPKAIETPVISEITKVIETPVISENPKAIETPQVIETPKAIVSPEISETPTGLETPELPSEESSRSSVFGSWEVALDLKTHRYTATDGSVRREGMRSVTGFIKSLFPEFDSIAALKLMGKKKHETVYPNMSDEQILAYWRLKCAYASQMGTLLHDYMDRYLKLSIEQGCYPEFPEFPPNQPFVVPDGMPASLGDPVGEVINPETLRRFIQTLIERGLEPVATEVCLYDDGMRLAGTTDGIFRSKSTGELWCFDWKRMPKMLGSAPFSSWGFKGTPVEHSQQSKKLEVSIQLNLYRALIQREGKQFPQPITHLCAVMIHPQLRKGFREIEFPIEETLTAQLVQMLENQSQN